MKNIQETLLQFTHKYQKYMGIIVSNMRLILLVGFAALSILLILKVDDLVSENPIEVSTSTPSALSKKPDADVISVFNELQSQDIEVTSQFDTARNNPF